MCLVPISQTITPSRIVIAQNLCPPVLIQITIQLHKLHQLSYSRALIWLLIILAAAMKPLPTIERFTMRTANGILTAFPTAILLLSTNAFAHQIAPQTEFFQEAVKSNPLTGQVLAWCSLVGLDEERCRTEMYEKSGQISEAKIDSVAKCVDASGLKYRIAMDKYFKTDINAQNLVSHQAGGAIWHLGYIADKNDGTSDKPHRHFYTDVDMQEAARFKGDEFVERLKRDHAKDSVTETSSKSGTAGAAAGVIIAEGTVTGTIGSEKSVTKAPLTEQQIAEARTKGEDYGRSHPEATPVAPHGVCYKQGDCITPTKVYENSEYPRTEGVAGSTAPKPETPKEDPKPPKDEPKADPFAPILPATDTGGAKTSEETKKESEKDKGVTTPVYDVDFTAKMKECVDREENEWYHQKGSKTEDPNAKTKEEKKAEAEELLKQGICDRSYYSEQFCHDFDNKKYETKEENADAKAQEEYDLAMAEFQRSGYCDSKVLSDAFCAAVAYALEITTAEKEPEATEEDTTPVHVMPGNHISTSGGVFDGENPNPENPVPKD